MKISFFRPSVSLLDVYSVVKCLASRNLTQSDEVSRFEENLSEILGTESSVSVNSGTSALILTLMALGLKEGDEVLVPNYTFVATANAVKLVGAVPVLVDVDPETFCIDPKRAQMQVTNKTRAIIAVHLFGAMADLSELLKLCRQHNLLLVEDAAQAFGSSQSGRYAGTIGHAGAYSFYPTKNFTSAEGGAITFSEPEKYLEIARRLRNQGQSSTYMYHFPGFNFRLNSLSAALGRNQLRRLSSFLDRRQRYAGIYKQYLPENVLQRPGPNVKHTYNQFVIKVPSTLRDAIREELESNGIPTRIYYPSALCELDFFSCSGESDHLVSSALASSTLALPIGPHLSSGAIRKIARTTQRILEREMFSK